MSEFSKLLRWQPENPYDDSVAVSHDNQWYDKHDDKLIPGKQHPLCGRVDILFQAFLFDFPRMVVIKQDGRRLLSCEIQINVSLK